MSAISILDLVRSAVTPDVVRRVSGVIGETPAATEKAFGAAVPAILAGAAERASTPTGAEGLLSMITQGGYSGGLLDTLGSQLGVESSSRLMQAGARIISSLFGGHREALTDTVASAAGMRRGSVTSLLSLAAPIVMSVLGKQIASRGLDATGLISLLGGQRDAIMALVPGGLAGLLGGPAPRAIPDEPVEFDRRRPSLWGWPLLAAILAGVALLFLFARGRDPEVATPALPTPGAQAPAASIRQSTSLALPDGRTLSVNRGGFLDQLNGFLAGKVSGDLPRRFVFDDLNFEPGTTTLTTPSRATVEALGSVLKGYPAVQVSLEGHTDSTGDAVANKKLSLDRAEGVKAMLAQAGVAADRISVAGYGQERPVASNDTDDGRAANRRTELVVMRR
jgi:outer membrane protein OmpA-like peptidoglycan-associated protein